MSVLQVKGKYDVGVALFQPSTFFFFVLPSVEREIREP